MSDGGSHTLHVPPHSIQPVDQENNTERSVEDVLPTEPPDGGRGWLVVFGSSLALFSTTGIINAYGFFQSFYSEELLSQSSSTTISLIGALQVCLVYAGSPITGRLFDSYGSKILVPLGGLLVVLSLMIMSFCQQNRPYQFFLVQGMLFGMGNSMIFTPAIAVVGHWFKRRRAYALGIIVAGSSLGGVIYPIILQQLQPTVGFAWAVRVIGFLTLACLLMATLTIRTHHPTRKAVIPPSSLVDLYGFRDLRYTLATLSAFLYSYAFLIPSFYIEEYAKLRGVSSNISPYLLAIINGCAIPARIIPGLLGDRFGVLPVMVPSAVFAGVSVLALWLPSRGNIPVILFSVLYGVFSSSFVSMLPAYIATITPVQHYGARLGTVYFFVAVATLVGTPTAGAFVPTFTQEHFDHLIIFTGVLLLSSATLIGAAHKIHCTREGRSTVPAGESSETDTAWVWSYKLRPRQRARTGSQAEVPMSINEFKRAAPSLA